jgi:hypothetical protein
MYGGDEFISGTNDMNKWKVGRTLVLLPYNGLQVLQQCEAHVKDTAATTIQSMCRICLARQSKVRAMEAAKTAAIERSATRIATAFRTSSARAQYVNIRRAVIVIQHLFRFRYLLNKRAESVVRIQVCVDC